MHQSALALLLFITIVPLASANSTHAPVEPHVIGGTAVASPDKYPYVISLQTGGKHFCGGSILTEDTILTAAHCVLSASPGKVEVYVGHTDLTKKDPKFLFKVASIRTHSDYNINKNSRGNDIAVLKLASKMSFKNKSVAQVCLPRPSDKPRKCTIIGWGKTSSSSMNPSSKLMEAPLPIIADSECHPVHRYNKKSLLCVGVSMSGGPTSSCYGDSGGPYLCEVDGQMLQFGLVSYGSSKGCDIAPVFFTKVASFLDWIQKG